MERFSPKAVKITITTNGPGDLRQKLFFPDGTEKSGSVRIDACEEGDEALMILSLVDLIRCLLVLRRGGTGP